MVPYCNQNLLRLFQCSVLGLLADSALLGSFTPLRFQNLSVLALRSHCSAVKIELFENAIEKRVNLKTVVFENDPFQCERQKGDT